MSDVDMEFTISERVVSDTPILDPIRKPTTDAIVALAAALPNVPSVKGLTVRLGRFNGAYWDRFASEVLAAMPGWRLLPADAVPDAERLRDIVARVPATAKALQYVNPNVREDAYNKGVQDLADAIARAALAPETPR